MPKMKTISSAKKRFKITGTGKIRRAKAFHNHCLEHKSSKQGRRLRQVGLVDDSQVRGIKRMLLAGISG